MTIKYSDLTLPQRSIISAGKQEIDDKLGGGIPRSSLTLVEGLSDSGKSVLLQQICHGALKQGLVVNYYTTENTVRSLLSQMESLKFSVTDYLLLGMMRIYAMRPQVNTKRSDEARFFQYLAYHCSLKEAQVIIIDSLTNLVNRARYEEVLDFFMACKKMCDLGKTVFFSVHPQALQEEYLIRLRSICDVHLVLHTETLGNSLRKVLQVSKVRGATQNTGNVVSFEIEPNLGIRVFPIAQALA